MEWALSEHELGLVDDDDEGDRPTTLIVNRRSNDSRSVRSRWRNQFDVGEVRSDPSRISGEEANFCRSGVRTDEEIRQWCRLGAAPTTVIEERARRQPRRRPRKTQTNKPDTLNCALQPLLCGESHREFGVHDLIDGEIAIACSRDDVLLRPLTPSRRRHDVEKDTCIQQRDQSSAPRVRFRISSALSPPSARSRSCAISRCPSPGCSTGRTSAPSLVPMTSTSEPGPIPNRSRSSWGMVT